MATEVIRNRDGSPLQTYGAEYKGEYHLAQWGGPDDKLLCGPEAHTFRQSGGYTRDTRGKSVKLPRCKTCEERASR